MGLCYSVLLCETVLMGPCYTKAKQVRCTYFRPGQSGLKAIPTAMIPKSQHCSNTKVLKIDDDGWADGKMGTKILMKMLSGCVSWSKMIYKDDEDVTANGMKLMNRGDDDDKDTDDEDDDVDGM